MSITNAGWPVTQTLSSCDCSCGRTRSGCRSDEVHESSFPYLTPQCWHASKDDIAKFCDVRLSHWDEHAELLVGATRHPRCQLSHDAGCSVSRCGIWFEWVCFQVLHTSTSDILKPHSVCVLSWLVLNVVTFMQFLCRSQRHSLRADCGIS